MGLAFLATAHGEFTAKGINRSGVSTIVNASSLGMTKACPRMNGQAFATASGGCRLVLLVSRLYYAGLRWSRTYSSVPVLPPLLVPEGWQDSYGLDWVGQPV